jgi:hypothetical protein
MNVYHPYEVDLSYKITVTISIRRNLHKQNRPVLVDTEKWTKYLKGKTVHVPQHGYTVLRASNDFNHGLFALITHSKTVLLKFKCYLLSKVIMEYIITLWYAAALSITKFGIGNEDGLKVRTEKIKHMFMSSCQNYWQKHKVI